jgi:sRNA-binding protein
MSETYERIWLQNPNTDPENEWCGETTWCQDKINDSDVEYVRADVVESLRQQLAEQKRLTALVYQGTGMTDIDGKESAEWKEPTVEYLRQQLAECQAQNTKLSERVVGVGEIAINSVSRDRLAECQAELKQANEIMKATFMSGFNEGEKLGKRRGVLEVSIWFENETVKNYNSREIASTLRRMVGA